MKIVFFYSEVMGYTEGTFRSLVELNKGVTLDVIYWDKKKLTPFKVNENIAVNYHPRSSFNLSKLTTFLIDKNPDILFLSGWMDNEYIQSARKYKKQNPSLKILAGIDDQWKGNLRQHIGSLLVYFRYKNLFDYMWVTGMPQYHYARRMGYGNNRIISNLYSANTYYFKEKTSFSKRLVFVGRFNPVKGINNLMNAYKKLPDGVRKEWPLIIIGNGPLEQKILSEKTDGISILPFLQPSELLIELKKGGVFCLPSLKEAWGVVIHEMAILGYPLLTSSVCGAATEFLINGYNGFLFSPNDESSLLKALIKITSLNQQDLELFSERSHLLGQRINSQMTASSLTSILD